MIVLKLKNLVFFRICYSICSKFITNAATDITLYENSCSAIAVKKLEKNIWRN